MQNKKCNNNLPHGISLLYLLIWWLNWQVKLMPLDCQDDIGQHAMTFGHALFFEILAHEYLEPIIKITTNMYFNTLLKILYDITWRARGADTGGSGFFGKYSSRRFFLSLSPLKSIQFFKIWHFQNHQRITNLFTIICIYSQHVSQCLQNFNTKIFLLFF